MMKVAYRAQWAFERGGEPGNQLGLAYFSPTLCWQQIRLLYDIYAKYLFF